MINSLIEHLKKVKDFRGYQGKIYPMWWVLLLVILAKMSGYQENGYFVKMNYQSLNKIFNISP